MSNVQSTCDTLDWVRVYLKKSTCCLHIEEGLILGILIKKATTSEGSKGSYQLTGSVARMTMFRNEKTREEYQSK